MISLREIRLFTEIFEFGDKISTFIQTKFVEYTKGMFSTIRGNLEIALPCSKKLIC